MFNITLYGTNTKLTLDANGEVNESSVTGASPSTYTKDVYGIYETPNLSSEEFVGLNSYKSVINTLRKSYTIECQEVSLNNYSSELTSILSLMGKKYHYLKTNTFTYQLQTTNKVVGVVITGIETSTDGNNKFIKINLDKVVANA